MRVSLAIRFALSWWVGWAATSAWSEGPPRPPNVIVIFIDDMGWQDLSCFGNREVRTTKIDELASEGIRFENFYVNSPICSPSRVAISTGQYPQRWRIGSYLAHRRLNELRGMVQWLDPAAPMLSRLLQQSGYATGHFGKWHMGGQRDVGEAPLITEYGFDVSLTNFEGLGPRVLAVCDAYDGTPIRRHALGSDQLGHGPISWRPREQVTEAYTRAAIEFIKGAQSREQPFYLNLWPDDVHSPFYPPQAQRGDGSQRALYLGVLETMDRQLGELFDLVRTTEKLRTNTVIVLCSDNGPQPGAGRSDPLRGYKTWLYEGGIRSPLIVWGDGWLDQRRRGSVNRESFFSAIDLVPSLLEMAGVETPRGVAFDGEDMSDALLGNSSRSREAPLFFRRPPDRDTFWGDDDLPDLAMRHGKWKLLCEYDGSDAELYDLSSDPSESTNLVSAERERAKRMIDELTAWHVEMPADRGPTFKIERR